MSADNSAYNYLSSRARAIIGGQIPQETLSLVVEYYGTSNIDKIDFQIPPMLVTESKNAHYASENILGRFEPIRMYTNSDATKISFDVSYYWLEDNFVDSINSWEGCKQNIAKLRALMYPYSENRTSTAEYPKDLQDSTNIDILAQYVGKMTPPPLIRLFFGDVYNGTPCILTGLNIAYNGPWNDASLAAVSRRMAAQLQSRFSDALQQNANINLGTQSIDPVSRIVDMIPTNWGVKGYLTNALQTITRTDQLFPLETKVSLTFETNFKFGIHLTYNDIKVLPTLSDKPTVSKTTANATPLVGTGG